MPSREGQSETSHSANQGVKGRRPAPGVVAPKSIKELQQILDPASGYPTPIRPMGANSSCTACTAAVGGTVVDTTSLKNIGRVENDTVTCDAGVTLRELADNLAEQGLEISGALDLMNRTVGGAVASGCFGPSHDGTTAFIASQAISMELVLPNGRLMQVDSDKDNLLNAVRISFGTLGIIATVTFRVRPQEQFVLKQRRMDVETFGRAARVLINQPLGMKFFYLPFKDVVFTELRRSEPEGTRRVRNLPWKLKELGETTVLPSICGKLGRIVPIPSLRYSLVDGLHGMTQSFLTSTLTAGGFNSVEFRDQGSGKFAGPPLEYTTWCFPAEEVGMLLTAYRTFATDYYTEHKFRCDMPVVGFRLPTDRSALLSPSFDRPMFALRFVSSPHPVWEDFVMELADFAQRWGGSPLLNQSRSAEPGQTAVALGSRLEFFRKIRRRMDPDGRMLNPFLSQYLS
ncbi:MAG: FAD-binding oxidoreductase [Pseudomonadota bacterium]